MKRKRLISLLFCLGIGLPWHPDARGLEIEGDRDAWLDYARAFRFWANFSSIGDGVRIPNADAKKREYDVARKFQDSVRFEFPDIDSYLRVLPQLHENLLTTDVTGLLLVLRSEKLEIRSQAYLHVTQELAKDDLKHPLKKEVFAPPDLFPGKISTMKLETFLKLYARKYLAKN